MPAPPPFSPAQHAAYMAEAIAEARLAGAAGDVPVGAVVVHDTRIVGRGHNRREQDGDPTAHAEIIALRQAAQRLGHWRLEAHTLYVTLEPCPMCAGALVNARLPQLVYGCPDPKAGAVRSLFALCEDPRLNHRLSVVRGVQAEPCRALLRAFFAELRRKQRR